MSTLVKVNDKNGKPIESTNPFPVELSGSLITSEKNKAVTAATDIITDYTATQTKMTTLMIETNTAGVLSLEVDAILASLNNGVALDAGKWYSFDIPMIKDLVYQLQFSVNATMQIHWIGGV